MAQIPVLPDNPSIYVTVDDTIVPFSVADPFHFDTNPDPTNIRENINFYTLYILVISLDLRFLC